MHSKYARQCTLYNCENLTDEEADETLDVLDPPALTPLLPVAEDDAEEEDPAGPPLIPFIFW